MIRQICVRLLAFVFPLALTACDGPDAMDFHVTRAEPVTTAYAGLGAAALEPEIAALFPGLKVLRSRPDDQSVLYTIPGSGSAESTILLRFASEPDGRSAIISAAVVIPAVRAMIDGRQKVISEARVERELRALLTDKSGDAARKKLSGLLAAIAIATDPTALAEVQLMMKDPARATAALAALESGLFEPYDPEADADSTDTAQGTAAQPADQPEAAEARADEARREAEWREQRRLSEAAAADDAASGEDPEPAFQDNE